MTTEAIPATDFFITGGTLPPTALSYITRQADHDLYAALRRGEYCYVLNSRQMGKSSLCVRTIEHLKQDGYCTVFLDLTRFGGKNITSEQWYAGMLSEVGRALNLRSEFLTYWKANTQISPLQRLFGALQEVALSANDLPHVLFIDEIDITRSLNFSTDEFFAAIRQLYVGRASDPDLQRLVICLLGSATPAELIQDTRVSPFNIGTRIDLRDFTQEEAQPLAEGLVSRNSALPPTEAVVKVPSNWKSDRTTSRETETQGTKALERVLYWTGGHPYLTQRLCRAIVEDPGEGAPSDVDRLCKALFLTHRAQETDDNLAFVRNRLLKSEVDLAALLELYGKMRASKRVPDDETNVLCSVVKLSGVARVEDGLLRVRNRIYAHVFDRAWVVMHLPDAELRRQRSAFRRGLALSGALSAVVLTSIGVLAIVAFQNARRAEKATQDIKSVASRDGTRDAQERMDSNDLMGATTPLLEAMKFDSDNPRRLSIQTRRLSMTLNGIPRLTRLFACGASAVWTAFSPDEKTIAVAAGHEIRLWDVATERAVAVFPHPDDIQDAAFRPDGKQLAVGCNDGNVYMWDTVRNMPASPVLHCPNPVHRVLWRGDGKLLAATFNSNPDSPYDATVWDTSTHQVRYHVNQLYGCYDLAFSPDNRRLIVATASFNDKILDADTGEILSNAGRMRGAVHPTISFSPNGKQFVIWGPPNGIGGVTCSRIVDLETGRALTPDLQCTGINCYSPVGDRIAVVNSVDARILDAKTGDPLLLPLHNNAPITAIAFNSDASFLLTACTDGTINIWDTSTGALAMPPIHHAGAIHTAIFDSSGTRVLAVGDDGTVRLWDLTAAFKTYKLAVIPVGKWFADLNARLQPIGRHLGFDPKTNHLQFWDLNTGSRLTDLTHDNISWTRFQLGSDGSMLLTTGKAGDTLIVQSWNTSTGLPVSTLLKFPTPDATTHPNEGDPTFSPDCSRLLLPTGKGKSELRNTINGAIIATLPYPVRDIEFSEDGSHCLAHSPNTLHIISTDDGSEHAPLVRSDAGFPLLSLSPHGKFLAYMDGTGTVWLRETATGRLLLDPATWQKVRTPGFPSGRFCFSPDEQRLLAATPDGWVLIDTLNGQILKRLTNLSPPDKYFFVSLRPDSKRLLFLCPSKTILFDLTSGKQLLTLGYMANPSHFSPDGKRIAWAEDNCVLIYNTDTGRREQSLAHPSSVRNARPIPDIHKLDYSALPAVWFSPDGRLLLTNADDGKARLWDTDTGERVGPPIPMLNTEGDVCMVGADRVALMPSHGNDGEMRLLALPPPTQADSAVQLFASLSDPTPGVQDGNSYYQAWLKLRRLKPDWFTVENAEHNDAVRTVKEQHIRETGPQQLEREHTLIASARFPITPNDQHWRTLSNDCLRAGWWQPALNALDELEKQERPREVGEDILYARANAQAHLHNYAAAANTYRRLLARQPDDITVLREYLREYLDTYFLTDQWVAGMLACFPYIDRLGVETLSAVLISASIRAIQTGHRDAYTILCEHCVLHAHDHLGDNIPLITAQLCTFDTQSLHNYAPLVKITKDAINPKDPDDINQFALVLCRAGQYSEALKYIQSAIRLRSTPETDDTYVEALALHGLGRDGEATLLLDKLIAKYIQNRDNMPVGHNDPLERILPRIQYREVHSLLDTLRPPSESLKSPLSRRDLTP